MYTLTNFLSVSNCVVLLKTCRLLLSTMVPKAIITYPFTYIACAISPYPLLAVACLALLFRVLWKWWTNPFSSDKILSKKGAVCKQCSFFEMICLLLRQLSSSPSTSNESTPLHKGCKWAQKLVVSWMYGGLLGYHLAHDPMGPRWSIASPWTCLLLLQPPGEMQRLW